MGIGLLLKIRGGGGGGGFQEGGGEGPRGREGVWSELGFFFGGGPKYFFRARNVHQEKRTHSTVFFFRGFEEGVGGKRGLAQGDPFYARESDLFSVPFFLCHP